jgi:hypothetical protein
MNRRIDSAREVGSRKIPTSKLGRWGFGRPAGLAALPRKATAQRHAWHAIWEPALACNVAGAVKDRRHTP